MGYRKPYLTREGARAPSVTQIVKMGMDPGGLIHWACQRGQESPDLPVREALYAKKEADIGTAVHGLIHTYLKTGKLAQVAKLCPEVTFNDEQQEQIARAFQEFLDWLDFVEFEFVDGERRLCSSLSGEDFAGTPDCWGYLGKNRTPVVLDWKTSKRAYESMPLQLVAYAHLLRYGLDVDNDYEPIDFAPEELHLLLFSRDGRMTHKRWSHSDDLHLLLDTFCTQLELFSQLKQCRKLV